MFTVMDGLDDVFIVSRIVKKAPTFPRGSELGEDVLAGERHEIVCGVKAENCTQMSEYPRCVVFELEVVLCGWCEFVAGAKRVSIDRRKGSAASLTRRKRICDAPQSRRQLVHGPALHSSLRR